MQTGSVQLKTESVQLKTGSVQLKTGSVQLAASGAECSTLGSNSKFSQETNGLLICIPVCVAFSNSGISHLIC